MSAPNPGNPEASVDPQTVAQAGSIVQRLVSEAQQNVDEILQMLMSAEAKASAAGPLAPHAYDAFSTRWSGLSEVLMDPRTGLSSRILFWDRVCHAALRHRRYQTRFALLYIDSGDRDEMHVPDIAILLGKSLRATDTISYAGQGEFTILLDQMQADADALAVADRVRQGMAESREADPSGAEPARVGVAVFSGRVVEPTGVLWDAYAAMRQARAGSVAVAAPRHS